MAFFASYSRWATSSVFFALKLNSRFACRCSSVRSKRSGGGMHRDCEVADSMAAVPA
jgi:hypothetical protein